MALPVRGADAHAEKEGDRVALEQDDGVALGLCCADCVADPVVDCVCVAVTHDERVKVADAVGEFFDDALPESVRSPDRDMVTVGEAVLSATDDEPHALDVRLARIVAL